jgi:HD-GYP domain-containing protein (c-di-GMP phosphodiesterase class II)
VTPASAAPPRRLVAALFGTLKLMQMYGADHATTKDALRNLAETIAEAAEDGELKVSVRGTRVQINSRTMRASECGALALSFLADEWKRRSIEHVSFSKKVTPDELALFSVAFLEVDTSFDDPTSLLVATLDSGGCGTISITRREQDQDDPLRLDGVHDHTKLRRARRAVQGLVDSFLEDEAAVLALAQIRGHDVKLFHHSLNVCIHALLIGQRLGMTRRQLGELGLAGLLHDLGKTVPLSEEEKGRGHWRALRAHPARGARLLLEDGTAHEGMLKAAIAAYEHHAHFDRSGFPAIDHELHLTSRIVAIADCYEALTGPRPYREVPYTPYDALSLMQTRAGTIFDPLLLKVFVNALGAYPVGSLVQLESGEIAIVCAGPERAGQLDRPRVRVVRTASGTLPPDTGLDLSATEYRISRTLQSNEVFDSVSEFVSAI